MSLASLENYFYLMYNIRTASLLFSGGINPAHLPRAKINGNCTPIYPHQRLRVNTIFEVVKSKGKETAYTDKYPS